LIESLDGEPVAALRADLEHPFFTAQRKNALENSGRIDPERIEEYIAAGGYSALVDALSLMTPAGVVQQVMRSGLRGRGGGGYPTGLKWSTVAKARAPRKYVICNGDEGDPGAFMDRSVLESDPHRVIEGMTIAGYATGASEGFIYVRAEYPLAVKRLKLAIKQAEKLGLLGNEICDTTFSFRIDIRLGAGAFVCGEETALIASIEGGRGTPRPRPPYPAEVGLWGRPTLINNVETYANIAPIIRNGGNWFAATGTAKSKGTKVFALAGTVNNTGLIEVPMGITLREVIFEIGGGIPDGKRFKAVQNGGPSGGCLPEDYLDMPVDYESLVRAGSIMGSGGMIVMDETSCMVDVARYFMDFCMTESCGKCVPCRVGTVHMHDLLKKMTEGRATVEDLEKLEELCEIVQHTSLCGLGQTAPNPVLSTLRYFRDEYIAHIVERRCPAGVCHLQADPQEVPA
jgi:bidirectional [NiFe] hydrogenase diaphorase subunit